MYSRERRRDWWYIPGARLLGNQRPANRFRYRFLIIIFTFFLRVRFWLIGWHTSQPMTFGCGGCCCCSLQRMQLKVNDSCVRRFSSCRPLRPPTPRPPPGGHLRLCLCAEKLKPKKQTRFFFLLFLGVEIWVFAGEIINSGRFPRDLSLAGALSLSLGWKCVS